MAPKKKIVKRIVKTVRKVVPAAPKDPPSPAAVEPAPAPEPEPMVTEAEAAPEPAVADACPAVETEPATGASSGGPPSVAAEEDAAAATNAGGDDAEKDVANGCEAFAAGDEAPEVAEGGDAAGKKKVKKVRKVKKVVVRKVLKAKEPAKETAAVPAAEEIPAIEENCAAVVEEEKPGEVAERSAEAAGGGGKEEEEEEGAGAASWEAELTERQKRRRTEIFIGGLDWSATEKDVRDVFERIGKVVEVRLMTDAVTGKGKGYAFLRYATPAMAKKALAEFSKVKVCGKLCRASAVEGNDTIYIGNIDKKWKKEDVIKLLKEIGVERIDAVTVMPDPENADINRGFAFLDLETNRDAQLVYKKLQKDGAFGVHRNIKVSWATPLNEPDEEEMQKVKSVYAECIPSTWSEDKVKEVFGKFGEVERVVLSRNMQSAKRKDFAYVNYTTREAALSCIELFDKESWQTELKVSVKVSLAKPPPKHKQNKGVSKSLRKDVSKDKPHAAQSKVKAGAPSGRVQHVKIDHGVAARDRKSSTEAELVHLLREQASWKQSHMGYAGGSMAGPATSDYSYALRTDKRPYSSLGDPAYFSETRGFPRARLDTSYSAASSVPLSSVPSVPHSYFQRASAEYGAGAPYSSISSAASLQGKYSTSYSGDRYGRY